MSHAAGVSRCFLWRCTLCSADNCARCDLLVTREDDSWTVPTRMYRRPSAAIHFNVKSPSRGLRIHGSETRPPGQAGRDTAKVDRDWNSYRLAKVHEHMPNLPEEPDDIP